MFQRKLLWTVGGVLGGGAALYQYEPARKKMRHAYFAGERMAVVSKAYTKCFTRYWKTLRANYADQHEYQLALSNCHKECAEIARKAMEKNAGVYIKLGQHLAALTYILPPEWTEAMIPLQDKCPRSSFESIQEMVLSDSGESIESMFSSFNPEPLGTASLAQVHEATLRTTGQQVAVKVQHPSLAEFVPLDVLMTRVVFSLIDYCFPQYPLTWLADEMESSIFVELDFTEEAKNAMKTQHYFRQFYNKTALRIPTVLWAKPRILIMEYVKGCRIDDGEFFKAHDISPAQVSACLAHTFNNMIFTPGVGLHCDPHPGNLSIIPVSKKDHPHNFEIVLYDHGLYRQVPTETRRSYARFWLALLDQDENTMREAAKEFAQINDSQFRLFAAAITGRDFDHALTDVTSSRTSDEIDNMVSTIASDGLMSDIMVLLHSMPRIVLLILKTNDLTRYLDQLLASPLGPKRTFLIMATYCAQTVYGEGRERLAEMFQGSWGLRRVFCEFSNWFSYFKRQSQLAFYDFLVFSHLL